MCTAVTRTNRTIERNIFGVHSARNYVVMKLNVLNYDHKHARTLYAHLFNGWHREAINLGNIAWLANATYTHIHTLKCKLELCVPFIFDDVVAFFNAPDTPFGIWPYLFGWDCIRGNIVAVVVVVSPVFYFFPNGENSFSPLELSIPQRMCASIQILLLFGECHWNKVCDRSLHECLISFPDKWWTMWSLRVPLNTIVRTDKWVYVV